ncbi:glutamic acid-rich protein-like [Mangifera indica]|uniref:glutamic acid-rich protein-like n=1 Tax=Mangifera indica TaxID=29780 RepID=UPI001CFB5ECF|nr:glutamic acid-rich protein-like [Mangifera indica]
MASSKVEVESPATEDIEESFEVPSAVEEKVATPAEEAEVVVHEDDEEEEEEVKTPLKEENEEKEVAAPLVENEEDEADATFDDDEVEGHKLEDY